MKIEHGIAVYGPDDGGSCVEHGKVPLMDFAPEVDTNSGFCLVCLKRFFAKQGIPRIERKTESV